MPTDPLIPFHTKDNGDPERDYWTSEITRHWTKLNYQYDDLVPELDASNPDGTLNEERSTLDLEAHIQEIYPSTKNYVHRIRLDHNIKNIDFFDRDETWDKDSWDDYIINVVYDHYALNGLSYAIQFWVESHSDSRMVGQVYAFAGLVPGSAESGGCTNCGLQRDSKVLSKLRFH
ncbi:hypothetical protein GGR53DRAFT_214928 [Hypoxylon sp. FL1150]|nr:hypothetical protein GGR53DRAFT_214928 [Hypoxylon sp. FL1150]